VKVDLPLGTSNRGVDGLVPCRYGCDVEPDVLLLHVLQDERRCHAGRVQEAVDLCAEHSVSDRHMKELVGRIGQLGVPEPPLTDFTVQVEKDFTASSLTTGSSDRFRPGRPFA
jgi:hypothetical protein